MIAGCNKERIEIRPQAGPQAGFLSSPADIVVYGGSAGSGKTYALLLEPLRHVKNGAFGAVIFRRESTQIRAEGGLWDESANIYPQLGASPREIYLDWRFRSGARVRFAHLQYESDLHAWDGSQIALICFDQLESFSAKMFFYMLSRNRSICGVRPYIRATCNPVPREDALGGWLRDFLAWWINEESGLPIPERSGVVRYFVHINNEITWGDSAPELREKFGADCEPKSATFISASIYDNKILLEKNPGYLANLKALSLVDRLRLLGGNWNARESAGMFFKRHWFEIVRAAPAGIAEVRYWDQAATKHKLDQRAIKGPSRTAGCRLRKTAQGIFYITDMKLLQEGPLGVEQATENTASQDGLKVPVIIEQDPGQAGKQTAAYYVRKLGAKGFTARANPVHESKGTRAKPLSAQAEAGNVKLVEGPWNEAFLREAENYDGGITFLADQIDAASGAFNELTSIKRAGVLW